MWASCVKRKSLSTAKNANYKISNKVTWSNKNNGGLKLLLLYFFVFAIIATMETVAQRIISRFGGESALAAALGVDVSRVYRWTYPKSRGGTDGLIPAKHHPVILVKAQQMSIKVDPSDFCPPLPKITRHSSKRKHKDLK